MLVVRRVASVPARHAEERCMSEPAAYGADRPSDSWRQVIFEEAYLRIEPFLDPARSWGGSVLTVLASHTLRQAYPELSLQDVHVLVTVAHRVYLVRRLHALHGELPPD
jgi:hypothetical protein